MEVRFYLPLKPRAPIRATLSTPPPSRLNSPSLSPVSVLLRFAIHRTLLLLLSSSASARAFHPLSLSLLHHPPPFPVPHLYLTPSVFVPPFPLPLPRSLLLRPLFFHFFSSPFFPFLVPPPPPAFFLFSSFLCYGIKWNFLPSTVLVDCFFKYTIIDPLRRGGL